MMEQHDRRSLSLSSRRLEFIVNVVFISLISAVFYVSLKYLLPLILPFAAAFCIAAILQRPIATLSRRIDRLPHKLIASAVIAVSLATVGSAVVLIIGALINELSGFVNDIPALLSQLADNLTLKFSGTDDFIDRLPSGLQKYAADFYDRITADIPGLLLTAAESLSGLLLESFGAIGSAAMRLPSYIITLLITVISIFFIGLDYKGARKAVSEMIPQRLRKHIMRIKDCSADTILCLIKTYAFLMLLTFSELAAGFALFNLLGANIPYPVPLALLTAAVDILPVLGVGTVLIPWAVFDLFSGNVSRAIMLLSLYAIVLIIRNFLEPKLIGQRFGLHPALTLLAIYAGGKLFGFIGVFLLPLTLIIAKRLNVSGAFLSVQTVQT